MQSSEPHVAQKFVAIPPDLDSRLQEELLNSQIQSALLFFATSIYALCHCCYAQGLLCCSILYEARCYCRPCLAVLYCIVEAHPPFVDSISLQALLNSCNKIPNASGPLRSVQLKIPQMKIHRLRTYIAHISHYRRYRRWCTFSKQASL